MRHFLSFTLAAVALSWPATTPSAAQVGGVATFPHGTVPAEDARALAFSADGRFLAAGMDDGSVVLFDVETRREIRRYDPDAGTVVGLEFDPTGGRLYVASDDKRLTAFDLVSGETVASVDTEKSVKSFDLSPEGDRVVWGGDDGWVQVLDAAFQPVARMEAPNLFGKTIRFVGFGMGGAEVVATADEGNMAFWEVGQPDPINTSSLTRQEIETAAVDAGGTRVALAIKRVELARSRTGAMVAQATNTVRVIDWGRGRAVAELSDFQGDFRALALSPAGDRIFVADENGVFLHRGLEGSPTNVAEGEEARRIALSPGGDWLALAEKDRPVRVWQVSGLGAQAAPTVAQAPSTQEPVAQPAPAAAQGRIDIDQPAQWRSGTRNINVAVRPRRSLEVRGRVYHPSGVREVTLNGRAATVAPDPSGEFAFLGYVRVQDGLDEVEVVARPMVGPPIRERYPLRVTAQAAEAEAQGVAGATLAPQPTWELSTFQGRRWAVVVGISEYSDPTIRPLEYADDDARAFYDFLVSEQAGAGGFPEENVLLLLNQDATYRNLRGAFRDFLKQAGPGDVVVVYFAGHGSPDPDRLDDYYLVTFDTEFDRIASTGFPMEDVDEAVRDVEAGTVISIADACHSAGVGGQAGRRDLDINTINQAFLDRMATSSGVFVSFTASQVGQYSQEGEQWGGGHGAFTYHVLEALRGAGDEDGDGIVSLGEMMEYTRNQVRRDTNNSQIPTISQTAFDWYWPMSIVARPGDQEGPRER